jgi:Amt family ammonium transporter
MVNTILAPSACGLLTLVIRKHITGEGKDIRLDYAAFTNGILSGCVSITAGCNDMEPWAAIIVGIIASFVYCYSCVLIKRLQIDDPLDAF